MEQKDGGSAFPGSHADCPNPSRGMSLRDWFAGQFLAGFMDRWRDDPTSHVAGMAGVATRLSYKYADAMLKARVEEK